MIKLKSLIVESLEIINGDELTPEQGEQLDSMVIDSGINILSDKELTTVYLVDGKVAAGLWISYVGGVFSFDTIVGVNYRKQFYGARLIKQGLQMYREIAMDEPEAKLELDVVNNVLIRPLQAMGLKVLGVSGNHTIMGYGEQ